MRRHGVVMISCWKRERQIGRFNIYRKTFKFRLSGDVKWVCASSVGKLFTTDCIQNKNYF